MYNFYAQYPLTVLRKEMALFKKDYKEIHSALYADYNTEEMALKKKYDELIGANSLDILNLKNIQKLGKHDIINLMIRHKHNPIRFFPYTGKNPPPTPADQTGSSASSSFSSKPKGATPMSSPRASSTTGSAQSHGKKINPKPAPSAAPKKRGRPSTKAPPPASRSSSKSSTKSWDEEFDFASGPGPILGGSMPSSTSKKSKKVKVGRKKRSVISLPAITEIAKVRGRPRKPVL